MSDKRDSKTHREYYVDDMLTATLRGEQPALRIIDTTLGFEPAKVKPQRVTQSEGTALSAVIIVLVMFALAAAVAGVLSVANQNTSAVIYFTDRTSLKANSINSGATELCADVDGATVCYPMSSIERWEYRP